MAGGQTETDNEAGGARGTEGLPGTGGQVRPVLRRYPVALNHHARKTPKQLQVRCLALSAPRQPRDVLVCCACRFAQQVFTLIGGSHQELLFLKSKQMMIMPKAKAAGQSHSVKVHAVNL